MKKHDHIDDDSGNTSAHHNRDTIAIALIFLVALAFRLWYMEQLVIEIPIRGDAISYVQLANNMLNHQVFSIGHSPNPSPDAYFTPGYPFFIAACISVSNALNLNSYLFILVAQAIIGALVAALTFLLARTLLGFSGSVLAAVFAVFSPHLVSHGGYILTETLFSFFLILALYLFVGAIIRSRHGWFALSGVLFGCAYLINPIIMFAPPLLALVALHYSRPRQTNKRTIAIFLLLYTSIFGAWQLRNALQVPDSAADNSDRIFWNFIIGMHSDYHEVWRANTRDPDNPADVDKRNFDGSYSILADTLWTRIKERPGHYLFWYFVQKPIQLWSWNILTGQGDIYVYPVQSSLYFSSPAASMTESLMKSLHFWLFGAALLGLLFLWRISDGASRATLTCLYTVLVYTSATYVVLQSEPRYSVPLRPEMYICAVYFLSVLIRQLASKTRLSAKS